MNKIKYILVLMLALYGGAMVAQTDIDLAEYYYTQGQYEQAKLYYEKIYKTNKTNRVYTNYLNTLIALKDFENSESLVKKKIKDNSKDCIRSLTNRRKLKFSLWRP
jgi:tetratricopeptide (TPR) repeat protein